MERRRLADILHLGKPAIPCLKLLATIRRRSNPFQAAATNKGSLKTISQFSGCLFWLIHHKRLKLPPTPLRPAERSILFSEKSVLLSDGARSATSSHAPKKGCSLREVCEADLHVGVAFLLLEPVFVICASGFCIQ